MYDACLLYTSWGTDVVYKLRGMYGFVIWDKPNKRLFGARDIFGIKPFYLSLIHI